MPEPASVNLVVVFYYGLFIGLVVFFLLWEEGAPKTPFNNTRQRRKHILRNLGMLGLVILIADFVVGQGLLHANDFLYAPPNILLDGMTWPLPVQLVIALLASDLLEYAIHIASHRISWFWRLHAVHHSDPHLDVTSAGRLHPLEVSIHVASKIGLYALLGLPLWIEGVRAVLQNSLLFIQHANVTYPVAIERLRWLFVTPAMHRVHHDPALLERNYGIVFSFWDRLFQTFQSPESTGPLRAGLPGHGDQDNQSMKGMLLSPFRHSVAPTDRVER